MYWVFGKDAISFEKWNKKKKITRNYIAKANTIRNNSNLLHDGANLSQEIANSHSKE